MKSLDLSSNNNTGLFAKHLWFIFVHKVYEKLQEKYEVMLW